MSERRITVEEVKAAYAKTGMEPRRRTPYGNGACCAMRALSMAAGSRYCHYWGWDNFGEDYTTGFIHGFDGEVSFSCRLSSERYAIGEQDGLAVAAAIFGEAT